MRLPDEVTWTMMRLAEEPMTMYRSVCKQWMHTVDSITQDEWRDLFLQQVCPDVSARPTFDWKRAVMRAYTVKEGAVRAFCLWKSCNVSLQSSSGLEKPSAREMVRGIFQILG